MKYLLDDLREAPQVLLVLLVRYYTIGCLETIVTYCKHVTLEAMYEITEDAVNSTVDILDTVQGVEITAEEQSKILRELKGRAKRMYKAM